MAWIAASRDHPGCQFVTIGMDRVAFHRGVHQGASCVLTPPLKRGGALPSLMPSAFLPMISTLARKKPFFHRHHLRSSRRKRLQNPAALTIFDLHCSAAWHRACILRHCGRANELLAAQLFISLFKVLTLPLEF